MIFFHKIEQKLILCIAYSQHKFHIFAKGGSGWEYAQQMLHMLSEQKIYDRIIVDDEMRSKLGVVENVEEDEKPKKKRKSSVKSKKRTQNKSVKKEIDVKAEKVALAAGEVAKAEEEKEKSKNDEKVKIPTIEDSKEILYNKLEEVEEEHDNIVDHGDNVNKSEETQDSKN